MWISTNGNASSAVYTLSGGTHEAALVKVNANGVLRVTGGTVTTGNGIAGNKGALSVGPGGVVEVSGGTYIDTSRMSLNADGTFRIIGDDADVTVHQLFWAYGTFDFVLDETGVSTLVNDSYGSMSACNFTIDGSGYTGGAKDILLFSATASYGALGTNYTVTGLGTEGVDWSIKEEITPVHTVTLVIGTLYDKWASGYNLSDGDELPGADVEPDGLDNMMEYALGGNPTNDDAAAVSPDTHMADDGGASWFYHVHNQNTDPSLVFTVGATPNLVITAADTNDVDWVGETAESGGFKTVTNRTEMTTDAKFIKLEVSQ